MKGFLLKAVSVTEIAPISLFRYSGVNVTLNDIYFSKAFPHRRAEVKTSDNATDVNVGER